MSWLLMLISGAHWKIVLTVDSEVYFLDFKKFQVFYIHFKGLLAKGTTQILF